MSSELLAIMDHIERDKGISREVLVEAVESALLSAARKTIKGKEGELEIKFDLETGDIHVFSGGEPIESDEFGRIAAQTAKQVIIQKIREAERNVIYDEFKDKVDDIVSGTVYRFEKGSIIVNLGKTEGIIPRKYQVSRENYRQGQRIRAYVEEVEQTNKGPRIILSRTSVDFVKRLFVLEVPEIYEHIVEIKSIAREAGERTKIAVFSNDEKVDSVGACVGVRGSRVKNIVNELEGEKIDIIRWSSDLSEYIKNSLAPAEIMEIRPVDEENMLVVVNDDQLSLAIGKKGQNVRLAAELVGKNLDIKSAGELSAQAAKKKEGVAIKVVKGIGKKTAEALVEAGFDTVAKLAKADVKTLTEVPGVGKKTAEKIIENAKNTESK